MINFNIPVAWAVSMYGLIVLALIDAILNAVLATAAMIKRSKENKQTTITRIYSDTTDYVRITGEKYTNGHPIPKWVKSNAHLVCREKDDQVLLCAPLGWVYKKDVEVGI